MTSTALPIRVDEEGKVKYDDLLRAGQKQDKVCSPDQAIKEIK